MYKDSVAELFNNENCIVVFKYPPVLYISFWEVESVQSMDFLVWWANRFSSFTLKHSEQRPVLALSIDLDYLS